ncbi:MAG: hypothetical protein M3R27_14785 [Bacteroidota bacterium]|nr:hypothetical protein [Bacteroidota bacterium]
MGLTIRKRPLLLTIVCIMGFIWIVFSFPGVFSPSVKRLGDWYPALFGLIVAASFISFIGIWHMKRWGVSLYIVIFFLKQLLLISINDVSYLGIFFSAFFICSMLPFYRRMDVNL